MEHKTKSTPLEEMDEVKKQLFVEKDEEAPQEKSQKDEKPAKKKRVMTEAQLANLAKAREKAAELRRAKAEAAKQKIQAEIPDPAKSEDAREPTKEEKLHKFAEEVNAKLEAEKEQKDDAGAAEAEAEAPAAPQKPPSRRKRKSRWDEFEDGTLKVKETEQKKEDRVEVEEKKEDEQPVQAPKRKIKPAKIMPGPAPAAPKPVKIPGRFGPAPTNYSYGDQAMLDPARIAYNEQMKHVKQALVYRNVLPF
jgi:hypothetical protein